ncbi:MAG: shikimate dehydrogenase [Defluviitaleaceae bacterium]|nr:shikimate dehydrogenase [Defluviitaleaceae bacterium]
MQISGNTKMMGIIGSPVSHSLSPFIHGFFAKQFSDDVIYTTFDVAPENLSAAVRGAQALGIIGFNVTSPHKSNVLKYITALDISAQHISAANLLKLTDAGFIGYNTDIYGVQMAFRHRDIDVAGKKVAIFGASGTGRAAGSAMAQEGCKKITFINRTRSKAELAASMLKNHYEIDISVCDIESFDKVDDDILIMAVLPGIVPRNLQRFPVIFDANYSPSGCCPEAFGGLEMLVYQAAQTYEILRGIPVPKEMVDEALNILLNGGGHAN